MSRDELLSVHAFDQNNDGMVNEDEVNFYLSGNESYDQETFLNTGWLLMKNLFSKYEKKPAKNNSKCPFLWCDGSGIRNLGSGFSGEMG